jgi:hypothetical protein
MTSYNISSGLPDLPSGLTDKDAALVTPLYRAINNLAQQVSVLTGNVQYTQSDMGNIDQLTGLIDSRENRIYPKALEAIAYGDLVTLSVDAGKLSMRKADASVLNKPAHGICDTVGGVAVNSYGRVIFMRGKTAAVSGTSIGTVYYLSTAGAMQAARPVLPTVTTQAVAYGLGSAGIYLSIEPPSKKLYGSFYDTTTQIAAAINTAYPVTFNTTALSRGISIGAPTSRIVISEQGVYDFEFSAQADKTSGGLAIIDIWARINGADIADSNGRIRIQGNDSEDIVSWNYVLNLNAGDYFELVWATDDTSAQLQAFAAAAPHPLTPSIILTVAGIV